MSVEKLPLPASARDELGRLQGYWKLLARPFRKSTADWAKIVRSLCIVAQTLDTRIERLKARIEFLKNENAVLREEIALLRRKDLRRYAKFYKSRPAPDLAGPMGELMMRAINEESDLRARYQKMLYGTGKNKKGPPRILDAHAFLAGTLLRRPEPREAAR